MQSNLRREDRTTQVAGGDESSGLEDSRTSFTLVLLRQPERKLDMRCGIAGDAKSHNVNAGRQARGL
jgi:hypothetical protein